MLKLKLQYVGHLRRRVNSLEKTLMLGKIEDRRWGHRGQDGWMVPPTQWTWVWASSGWWWKTGKPGMLQSMGSQRVRHDWATKQRAQHVLSSQPSSHTDPKLVLSSVHPFAADITTICMCAQLLSCVWLFETLWTVAYQAQTWSMGSPRARILEWVAISFSICIHYPHTLEIPGSTCQGHFLRILLLQDVTECLVIWFCFWPL